MIDKYLRRYTDIPALVYLLKEKKVTLIDPQSWDDTNDSYYLALYKDKKKLKSLLALCFTQHPSETYHHWRVFASGSAGVCIRFQRSLLLKAIGRHLEVRTGSVKYLTLAGIRNMKPTIEDLPFLKRHQFQHEREFRIVYESSVEKKSTLDIPISLSCIKRIVLSPWLHRRLSSHLKGMLHSIEGCGNLEIVGSTLISNDKWKSIGESATK